MNSVNLIGNLVSDPEPHTGKSGTEVSNVRIAIQRRGEDNGAVFTNVKAFGAQAAAVNEYCGKGDEVAIDGRLELDEWRDKETDEPRSRLYVVAERVEFLRKKRSTDSDGAEPVASAISGVRMAINQNSPSSLGTSSGRLAAHAASCVWVSSWRYMRATRSSRVRRQSSSSCSCLLAIAASA